MKFIKENGLQMSDLFYALKYVRIANRPVEIMDMFKDIQQRLKKLREDDIAVVTPPSANSNGKAL